VTAIPAPLAVDATTAERPAGPCSVCHRAILALERYAVVVPSRKLAHVPCVAAAARTRRAVPVIR
jgi:hypothetical protein